jgi:hypothetical protein
MYLDQERHQLRAFVNMAMNILVQQDTGNVSTRRAIIASFEALLSTNYEAYSISIFS